MFESASGFEQEASQRGQAKQNREEVPLSSPPESAGRVKNGDGGKTDHKQSGRIAFQ